MKTKDVLVVEREHFGPYAGLYRVYDQITPDVTIRHIEHQWLPEFLDSCVIDPVLGIHWQECVVIDANEKYTVAFDVNYKRELAKSILAKLLALDTGLTMAEGEDTISEVESLLNDINPFPCEDLMNDYLGLTDRYSWIFID